MEYLTDPRTVGLAAGVASAAAAYRHRTGTDFKPLGIATLVAVMMLVIWVIISRTTSLAKNKFVSRWGSHIDWALGGMSAGFGGVLIARGGSIAAIWGEEAWKTRKTSSETVLEKDGRSPLDL
jgi:threonine/homoserine/homoserine lactone efflux protein